MRDVYDVLAQHLKEAKLPSQALCAMELRSPRPFTFQGFTDFNAGYVDVLKSWDILEDGLNPIARTNVAPAVEAPAEPILYGFSFTAPAANAAPTFVVAGGGGPPRGSRAPPHRGGRGGRCAPTPPG